MPCSATVGRPPGVTSGPRPRGYGTGMWHARGIRTPEPLRAPVRVPATVAPLLLPTATLHPRHVTRQTDHAIDWGPIPQEFFGQGEADTGERRLLLAVLTDGIGTALGSRKGSLLRREAVQWLEAMDLGRLSFRYCCEALGIEPTRVRRAILARVHGTK